jgi:diguanylate cyclase (GGDEF)-like protein
MPRSEASPQTSEADRTSLLSADPRHVRRRSLIVFGLVLTLGAALTAFVHQLTEQVMDVTMKLVDADMPTLEAISDLKVAVVAQEPLLYEYYATENRDRFLPAFEANQARIESGLVHLRRVFPDRSEPDAIGTDRTMLRRYARRLDETLRSPDTDWDLAREMLVEISRRSVSINGSLDRLVDLVKSTVKGRAQRTHALVSASAWLVLAFSAGVVVLTLIVGYYVNQSMAAAWQRRRLAMFAERNPNPIVTLSRAGDLLYANPSAQEMAPKLAACGDLRRALLPADIDARLQALSASRSDHARCEYSSGGRVLSCRIHWFSDLALFHLYILDITERKQSETRLQFAAYHDTLTALPNRRSFTEALERELSEASGAIGAVLLVNLEGLGTVVERFGYMIGDDVVTRMAARLDAVVSGSRDLCSEATLYRFEGAVFAVLMRSLPVQSPRRAIALASRFLRALEPALTVGNSDVFLTATIGIAQFPDDAVDTVNLLRNADRAVQQCKRDRGTGILRYSEELALAAAERAELELALRRALDRQELHLLYQPQIEIGSGRVIGVEALARWQHPQFGLVSPARFIPVAEETGLIVDIGKWILHTACQQARRWHQAGFAFSVGVNVSARQLLDPTFPQVIEEVLAECQLPPLHLELEITETAAMHDVDHTARVLAAIKRSGVRVAIDDFGTGYSSLNYLKRFSINKLKIDQSFVRHMTQDGNDAAIVQAVVELAHRLELRVIAEGVETEQHLEVLRRFGCDEAQGYLIAKPLPAREIEGQFAHRPGGDTARTWPCLEWRGPGHSERKSAFSEVAGRGAARGARD